MRVRSCHARAAASTAGMRPARPAPPDPHSEDLIDPAARHRRRPHARARAARVLARVGAGAACLLIAGVSTAAYFAWDLLNAVSSNSVDIGSGDAPHITGLGAVDGGFDMLIVGTDNDADQGDAYGERDATLNDVNIWLHVAADHSRAVAMSFPRDLVIPHPECTDPDTGETFDAMSAQPVNVAYERGGIACVAATLGTLTGEPFEYAAAVSFGGVVALSNAVGGVEICVQEAIDDPDAGLVLPAGTSVVQGETALGFLRTRHGIGDGSDLSRISNQQSFLSSLIRKAKSDETLGDPGKLVALGQVAADHMKLSTSMANPLTMASLALTLKDVPLESIVFVQYPGSTGSEEFPGKVVPIEWQAEELIAKIVADEPFGLGEDALGPGVAEDPASGADAGGAVDSGAAVDAGGSADGEPADGEPADGEPADGAADAGAGAADGADAAAPPASTPPETLDGIRGQSASQRTCAEAYSG
ncbi:LCP family protein [Agromyces archimandritae]|uniref:LCP family protein n=1 Tax=Agromyces archimandritae TaxID=2781962 RepID=A0A975FJ92_9MICO|nr:LCP family protein [Agromyces archimandritae]QTX03528.1 LCP family protein [Agromyces archimandritae]